MSTATTEGIRVTVRPAFWEERTSAANGLFAFTYTVRISNVGDQPVQLLRRRWVITDGAGNVQEVEGDGVVGKQPHLSPGETFEYTSWVPLPTPIGTMKGEVLMVRPNGVSFAAQVAEFVLTQPHALH
ncbi:MAG TPA: Co2+/Mg2+ efflux protein ApaG [Vulgatibacter sp.]